jgi:hypothetical protein
MACRFSARDRGSLGVLRDWFLQQARRAAIWIAPVRYQMGTARLLARSSVSSGVSFTMKAVVDEIVLGRTTVARVRAAGAKRYDRPALQELQCRERRAVDLDHGPA